MSWLNMHPTPVVTCDLEPEECTQVAQKIEDVLAARVRREIEKAAEEQKAKERLMQPEYVVFAHSEPTLEELGLTCKAPSAMQMLISTPQSEDSAIRQMYRDWVGEKFRPVTCGFDWADGSDAYAFITSRDLEMAKLATPSYVLRAEEVAKMELGLLSATWNEEGQAIERRWIPRDEYQMAVSEQIARKEAEYHAMAARPSYLLRDDEVAKMEVGYVDGFRFISSDLSAVPGIPVPTSPQGINPGNKTLGQGIYQGGYGVASTAAAAPAIQVRWHRMIQNQPRDRWVVVDDNDEILASVQEQQDGTWYACTAISPATVVVSEAGSFISLAGAQRRVAQWLGSGYAFAAQQTGPSTAWVGRTMP